MFKLSQEKDRYWTHFRNYLRLAAMEIDQEILKKIEDYLLGNLKEHESLKFEQEIATNSELKKEVDRMRLIMDSIELYGDEELKKKLDLIHEEIHRQSTPVIDLFLSKKMIAAAAVIIVLVSSFFVYDTYGPSGMDDIYMEYYEAPIVSNVSRDVGSQFSNAELYYRDKQYEKAFELFKIDIENKPEQLNIAFYMAICAHELGNDSVANRLFDEVISGNHPALTDDAKWYKALSFIKNIHPNDAKEYLLQLENDSLSFYSTKASNILELELFSE